MLSCEKVEIAKTKSKDLNGESENDERKKFIESEQIFTLSEQDLLDTECGFGFIRGKWLQKLTSKKSFLFVHAITGMLCSASYHYYSGILTTLEKQFKFTSIQMGYIGTIYDVVYTIISLIMPYICSRGFRRFPRWMGFAVFCYGVSFLICLLPYVIYEPGDEILSLTKEYENFGSFDEYDNVTTTELMFQRKMKGICYGNSKEIFSLNFIESQIFQYFRNRWMFESKQQGRIV